MPSYRDQHGRWRYRFAFRGKRYSGSTAKAHNTQRAADALERRHLEKLEARTFTGKMPTVTEFSVQFLDHQKTTTKPLTWELHTSIVALHINSRIGGLPIDEVNKQTISQLMSDWLAIPAAPRTVNTRAGVLYRMLKLAYEWEVLAAQPKVKLLKIAVDHPRFLTDDEAKQLLDATPPNWWTMVLVALRTGCRVGELRGLRWMDIELQHGALRVQRTDPGRAGMDASSPKGNKPRTIPLTEETRVALTAWHARDEGGRRPSDLVFPGAEQWRDQKDRERSRSETNCKMAITNAAKKAGLEDVTWHTLRHTYASHLVMRGVPPREVQALLGHYSLTQTERYMHLAPGFINRALVASLDFPMVASSPAAPAEPLALPPGKPQRRARRSGSQRASNDQRAPRGRPRKGG